MILHLETKVKGQDNFNQEIKGELALVYNKICIYVNDVYHIVKLETVKRDE